MRKVAAAVLLALFLFIGAASAQDAGGAEAESAIPPIRVWLPAPLIDDEEEQAYQLLREHAAAFTENNGAGIEFRLKNVGALGGIMATIRAGKEVAPGALPDLALIRRRDFTQTQALQYLQSQETLFSSSLINDLGDGLAFGQVPLEEARALYGMPYLYDLLLTVSTQPLDISDNRLRFADVLASGLSYLFPAARSSGLNQTLTLQYLAAAGMASPADSMAVDESALEEVLTFYQELQRQQLVDAQVLTYASPAAYRADFLDNADMPQLAVIKASDFLQLHDLQEAPLYAANIPTLAGDAISLLDGWLWVIVAPDHNRQAISARFLEWLMEANFHAAFAQAVYHLPSQPALVELSLPPSVNRPFFSQLLAAAMLPLPENEGSALPRLLQDALEQVLQGEADAAGATRWVLSQVADR